MDGGMNRDFPGLFLDGGDGDGTHAGDHGRLNDVPSMMNRPDQYSHPRSFVSERVNRVETRCSACGHESKEDADGGGEDEGDDINLRIE